jgi:hypothetical protein
MNLTSKRSLQVLSACVGAVAFTASAQTVWVSDNFEAEGVGSTNAIIDSKVGVYKSHIWGANSQYSNMVWSATANDASSIQTFEGSYSGVRPIAEDNLHAQVLKLETEGATLTRYVNFTEDDGSSSDGTPLKTAVPITVSAGTPIYVDTLMKFTPSDSDPEIADNTIKLALWVNAESNLVARFRSTEIVSGGPTLTVTDGVLLAEGGVPQTIDPERWYRLTVKVMNLNQIMGQNVDCIVYSIYLDNAPLTHAFGFELDENGIDVAVPSIGGKHLLAIENGVPTLRQVSFQGTGYVDDLVVADAINGGTPSGILLTLVYDTSKLSVLFDSNEVGNGNTVAANSTLTITATDFHRVASVAGTGVTFTPTAGDLGTNKVVTGTITADAAAEAVITAALWNDAAASTGFGGHTVSALKLAAWAQSNGLNESQVGANAGDLLDDYLLNVVPGTDAQLEITDIVVNGEEVTITVGATENLPEGFDHINGTLKVWGKDDLSEGDSPNHWGNEPNEYGVSLGAGQTATITIDNSGRFFKASVE